MVVFREVAVGRPDVFHRTILYFGLNQPMIQMRHLTKSQALVFFAFLSSIVNFAPELISASLAWKVGIRVLAGVTLVWVLYENRPQNQHPISKSGLVSFYSSFEIGQTNSLLGQAESEFCYFGVSFLSVWSVFKTWYLSPGRKNVKSIKLLIADPGDMDTLRFFASWEGKQHSLEQGAALIRDRIQQMVREVHDLGAPSIELRFHREKCREWIYVVDDKIFVGLVKKGFTRQFNPLLALARKGSDSGSWNLFDHYRQEWETVWESAVRSPGTGIPANPAAQVASAHAAGEVQPPNPGQPQPPPANTLQEVTQRLSGDPGARVRVSMLEEIADAPEHEFENIVDRFVLGEHFLGFLRSEEVREKALHFLGSTRCRTSVLRTTIEQSTGAWALKEPCSPLVEKCCHLYLEYYCGTHPDTLTDILYLGERRQISGLTDACLHALERTTDGAALVAVFKRNVRTDVRDTCLRALQATRPREQYHNLLQTMKCWSIAGEQINALLATLDALDPLEFSRLEEERGIPKEHVKAIRNYFSRLDAAFGN